MIKIGITGSLASGKSTVAKMISSGKYPLYNADTAVKKIYQTNVFQTKVFKKFKLKNKKNIKNKIKKIISSDKKYLKDLISLCSFDLNKDKKRGKFHYDSSVYPYICTAVIKGKWNFKEDKKELFEIFYNKKFNIFSYYLSKIKF